MHWKITSEKPFWLCLWLILPYREFLRNFSIVNLTGRKLLSKVNRAVKLRGVRERITTFCVLLSLKRWMRTAPPKAPTAVYYVQSKGLFGSYCNFSSHKDCMVNVCLYEPYTLVLVVFRGGVGHFCRFSVSKSGRLPSTPTVLFFPSMHCGGCT
jgi:hypothetical protein